MLPEIIPAQKKRDQRDNGSIYVDVEYEADGDYDEDEELQEGGDSSWEDV